MGYGLYAVGNTILMILLYFTDYGGAVAAAAVFAVSASGLTALSMAFDPAFYGFGFLIRAALFYLVTLFRLDVFTANLPYRVLGQQPIVAETKSGRFTRLGLFLEHKSESRRSVQSIVLLEGREKMEDKKLIPRRRVLGLGVALAGLCAGCAVLPAGEYRERCRLTGGVWGESSGQGGKGSAGGYQQCPPAG